MSSSADCTKDFRLARSETLKLKIREAGEVRLAKFGYPQPPYDRLCSWITGMLVMLTELEHQEYLDACQRTHAYLKTCVEDGKDPLAALKTASESSLLSPSGKWSSLSGKC